MYIKVLRILTPIVLIGLVAVALIFVPFEASSDSINQFEGKDLPEGTFP